ncbi:MAG TPA: helix-turn-helix transcriptional regulator [Oscillatoriaceae cyanobacterium]
MTEQPSASFSDYLSNLRTAKGLGLREAARAIGIAHSRLLDFEAGIDQHTGRPCTPAIATLFKIAAAYGVDAVEVLDRAGYRLPGVPRSEEERRLLISFQALPMDKRQRLLTLLAELQSET